MKPAVIKQKLTSFRSKNSIFTMLGLKNVNELQRNPSKLINNYGCPALKMINNSFEQEVTHELKKQNKLKLSEARLFTRGQSKLSTVS